MNRRKNIIEITSVAAVYFAVWYRELFDHLVRYMSVNGRRVRGTCLLEIKRTCVRLHRKDHKSGQ